MAFDFYKGEVLLVDKPYTWSSFQAVNKIKHAVKHHASQVVDGQKIKPKVGHAGTLDPLATGLLIVCTGKKTKTINDLMGLDKEYTGTFVLGATTPCFDLEKPVDTLYPTEHITTDLILNTVKQFVGDIEQVPPLYSAIMVEGKRAYTLARAGEDIELKARTVTLFEFEITRIAMPEVDFRIVCSKGTYIRSIARDFGLALNSGAYLSALRRTRIGSFTVNNAQSPQLVVDTINREDIKQQNNSSI